MNRYFRILVGTGLLLLLAGGSIGQTVNGTKDKMPVKGDSAPATSVRVTHALDAQGGPDAFGYRWQDSNEPGGPAYEWIELLGDPGATWPGFVDHDDGTFGGISIGWNFPFYGLTYSTLGIGGNGELLFTSLSSPYNNVCLPSVQGAVILPYWDDLHMDRGGKANGANVIGYKNFGSYFVVEFDSIGTYNCAPPTNSSLKFEVILYPSGEIRMEYNRMAYAACSGEETIGIQNSNGSIYLQQQCNNASLAPTDHYAVRFQAQVGPEADVACTAILRPSAQHFVNQTVSVMATFLNPSPLFLAAPVRYQLQGQAICPRETTAVLGPGASETHTFATPLTLPGTPGTYTFKAWTEVSNDIDHTNDTARVNIVVLQTCTGVVDVTIEADSLIANRMQLYFNAPDVGGHFVIYRTSVRNNNGDPRSNPDFVQVGDVTAAVAGLQSWTDEDAEGDYANHVVIHECRLGRCCYDTASNPLCADNTQSQCVALGGAWDSTQTCARPCPLHPVNDDCSGAIQLAWIDSRAGDNSACVATVTPAPACVAGYYDLWYRYTANGSGNVMASTCGANFDTIIDVLNGTCGGPMTSVGCNDDDCNSQSRVIFSANNGYTYYIRVMSYYATPGPSYQGAFTLTVSVL